MKEINQQVTPMSSHLVMFDKPKMGIVGGFLEEVHGMTISDYYCLDENGKGSFETARTILTGEDLNPTWHLDTFDGNLEFYHLKEFPKLSIKDIRECIYSAIEVRDLGDLFKELEDYGFTTELKGEIIEANISEYKTAKKKSYQISFWGTARISSDSIWIPKILDDLYTLQHFLKCKFHLNSKDLSRSTLDMMNELLENQSKNGIMVAKYLEKEECLNDGVYTYHSNGLKEPMTREVFMKKYPDAFDYVD